MKGHSGATELFTFLVVVVVKHCVHLLKRKKQLCVLGRVTCTVCKEDLSKHHSLRVGIEQLGSGDPRL